MSILIMYPFLQETASASSPTFPNDGVRLLATHTPIVLHVGNLFHIRTLFLIILQERLASLLDHVIRL
jgi:hypothetical protein